MPRGSPWKTSVLAAAPIALVVSALLGVAASAAAQSFTSADKFDRGLTGFRPILRPVYPWGYFDETEMAARAAEERPSLAAGQEEL